MAAFYKTKPKPFFTNSLPSMSTIPGILIRTRAGKGLHIKTAEGVAD